MELSSQKQVAGDGAQQNQAGRDIIINNNGVSIADVQSICTDISRRICQESLLQATAIASQRINIMNEILFKHVAEDYEFKKAFSDPRFQYLLQDTQRAAASTERLEDFELLAELLSCHVKKNDRKVQTSVHHAIKIVDEIDNDALCALTTAQYFMRGIYDPFLFDVSKQLSKLDKLYASVLYCDLPLGIQWLDHLDNLGAIRIMPFSKNSKASDLYQTALNGIICVGLKDGSPQYMQAIDQLKNNNLPLNFLQPHPYLDGYFCLSVASSRTIDDFLPVSLPGSALSESLKGHIKSVLQDIFASYQNDTLLLQQVKEKFDNDIKKYNTLQGISKWWMQIPCAFNITSVGSVLAYTNAKRCDPRVPEIPLQ